MIVPFFDTVTGSAVSANPRVQMPYIRWPHMNKHTHKRGGAAMPGVMHGKENSIDDTQISRCSALVSKAAMVAIAALPAAAFAAGTKAVTSTFHNRTQGRQSMS
jgi:hypothetical protein